MGLRARYSGSRPPSFQPGHPEFRLDGVAQPDRATLLIIVRSRDPGRASQVAAGRGWPSGSTGPPSESG